MHGVGTRFFPNGNILEGNWVNDKPHGRGIFYNAMDGSFQEAEWNEGKIIKSQTVNTNQMMTARGIQRLKKKIKM